MYLISILVLLFTSVITILREKHILSPSVIFSTTWFFIFTLAIILKDQFYEISTLSCLTIVIGTVSFCLTSMLSAQVSIKFTNKKNMLSNYKILNKNIYNIFVFVAGILASVSIIKAVQLILNGNTLNDIYIYVINARNGYNSPMALNRTLNILLTFLGDPIVRLIIPVSIMQFFSSMRYRYLIVSLFFTLYLVITTGGRINLFLYAIYLLIGLSFNFSLLNIRYNILNKKIGKIVKGIIIFISALFIFMTLQRGVKLIESIIKYLVGCVPHLSYRQKNLPSGYFWGLSSLQGFYRPFFSLLNQLGVLKEPFIISEVYSISDTESAVMLGPDFKFNSFVTPFYNFFIDGGLFGVLIGSLLLGFIAGQLFKNVKRKNRDIKDLSLFALFMGQTIGLSFMRLSFIRINYAWAFIFSLILFKNCKPNKIK